MRSKRAEMVAIAFAALSLSLAQGIFVGIVFDGWVAAAISFVLGASIGGFAGVAIAKVGARPDGY